MSITQQNPSINHHPRAGYYPDHERVTKLNHLADGITELVAHLDAGTFQLLKLICEFDENEGWSGPGIRSCAHWLNWKCGMSLGSARERVRVARALPELPAISAAFCKGKVSYSKVRAMTRVATAKNEAALLQVALHGTASHVETQVRLYRKTKRIEALEYVVFLHDWVDGGGSLLVFSEHAPFDQAIGSVVTFGGSSLSGEGYTDLFRLSASDRRRTHWNGVRKGSEPSHSETIFAHQASKEVIST